MNIPKKSKKSKGVALVFALFTIALLFSISTTVVAMSLSHSRDTKVVNYNDAALHAANWGIEAAMNYMGQPGVNYTANSGSNLTNINRVSQWVDTKYNNLGLAYGRHLRVLPAGTTNHAVNNEVNVSVNSLATDTMKKYGLAYKNGDTLGEDGWTSSYSGSDKYFHSRSGSDTREIVFSDASSGNEYCIYYKDGTYARVRVACTEMRYPVSNQPSKYQLVALAKVCRPKGASPKSDDPVMATRIVEANIRESMACDFMHFIQNARSWDAQGVDLGEKTTLGAAAASKARQAVFLPEGYMERGKLRVDGYDKTRNPENNALKMFLNKLGVDGTLGFLYESGSVSANKYSFESDVTTMRSSSTYTKKQRGGSASALNGQLGMFSGALNDGSQSLGLPNDPEYFKNARATARNRNSKTGQRIADISVGASNNASSVATYKKWHDPAYSWPNHKCPDIAQGMSAQKNPSGTSEYMKSAVPTFATVRVELCGDQVKILKYNGATADKYGNIPERYIENVTPLVTSSAPGFTARCNVKDITNGIISVTGGNVEVVNVKSFNDRGLSNDYVSDSDSGENGWLSSALTVVANVDQARDNSLNNQPGGSALYSDTARRVYDNIDKIPVTDPNILVPPYSQAQINILNELEGKDLSSYSQAQLAALGTRIKNAGSNENDKCIWPTPKTSATEREGNVVIGSDLLYGTKSNTSATLGIVAKNFLLLNDKSGAKRSGYKNVAGVETKNLKELRVDGVLMSTDHSLQYDWNNLACNSKDVIAEMNKSKKDYPSMQYRKFTLNGSIVSGFLDVEGDSYGRGYYTQNFNHDENLRYKLPPSFPRWDVSSCVMRGVFMDWLVLDYKDRGAINDL